MPAHPLLKLAILLVSSLALPVATGSPSPPPPLLAKIEQLHCAGDMATAKNLLDQLFDISPPGADWPDEWLGTAGHSPSLQAGTMDIILATLRRTAERFPDLRTQVERVALQWNYCQILEGEQFFNLQKTGKHWQRSVALTPVPLQWQGFRQWGFLTPDANDAPRFIPTLLSEITLAPHAYQIFLHRIYRQQCFPHPVTGKRAPTADADTGLQRYLFPPPAPEAGTSYPYQWHPYCEIPAMTARADADEAWPKTSLLKASAHQVQVQQTASEAKTSLQNILVEENPLQPLHQQQQELVARERALRDLQIQQKAAKQAADKEATRQAALKAAHATEAAEKERLYRQQLAQQQAAKQAAATETERLHQQALLLARIPEPAASTAPHTEAMIFPASPGSAEDIPFVYVEEDKGKNGKDTATDLFSRLKLSGTFTYNIPASGQSPSLKASFTIAPLENVFITTGTSYQQQQMTYSWSAGYSDWRPGTFSAQVNNWGPLEKGEGLALDKADLNLAYKFDSEPLSEYKLAASTGLSVPLSSKRQPSASLTLNWSPATHWYVRTTASQALAGDDTATRWSYAFGYYDWRPDKWRIEYSNYENNRNPFDNFEQGNITISRGWKF